MTKVLGSSISVGKATQADGEHDRRRARRLEQPHDQLAVRVDDGQVVEIVVVEAQLAQRGDDGDLPEHGAGAPGR